MLSNGLKKRIQWLPEKVIDVERIQDLGKFAIVVLNRKILVPSNLVKVLWQNAKLRITVDGGTNRWRDFLKKYCDNDECEMKSPELISGDFDSVTQETLDFFDRSQCRKVHTPDQNSTDFTKALELIQPTIFDEEITSIIVLHETSGRLDHLMANINTLFKANSFYDKTEEHISIYLLSSNSLTWLLSPNEQHSISIPRQLVENKRWCSLIPIGDKVIVTTTGLKWNLDNKTTQFGGMVSTSNSYATENVTIITNGYLLWSMGVFNFNDD